MKSDYKKKLKHIKAFVLDVDGVLTNGGLIIYPDGKFLRQMNAKDGYAIKLAITHGYIIGVITGGREQNIKSRLEKLGVKEVFFIEPGFTFRNANFQYSSYDWNEGNGRPNNFMLSPNANHLAISLTVRKMLGN